MRRDIVGWIPPQAILVGNEKPTEESLFFFFRCATCCLLKFSPRIVVEETWLVLSQGGTAVELFCKKCSMSDFSMQLKRIAFGCILKCFT